MSELNQPQRQTRLKRSTPNRRDCLVKWAADFRRKALTMHVDFIAPDMVIHFLNQLRRSDEGFQQAEIANVVDFCKRFRIELRVKQGYSEACYEVKAWQPEMSDDPETRPDLELTALGIDTLPFVRAETPLGRAIRDLFEARVERMPAGQAQNNQSSSEAPPAEALPEGQSRTAAGQLMPLEEQVTCEHDWQPDGQTITSVRWTCTKCGKTKQGGVDI